MKREHSGPAVIVDLTQSLNNLFKLKQILDVNGIK
jgi:hypothetical protein